MPSKYIATIILREIPEPHYISIDEIKHLYSSDKNLKYAYQAYGHLQDVVTVDVSAGNSAADRFALANHILNADADEFSAIDEYVTEYNKKRAISKQVDEALKSMDIITPDPMKRLRDVMKITLTLIPDDYFDRSSECKRDITHQLNNLVYKAPELAPNEWTRFCETLNIYIGGIKADWTEEIRQYVEGTKSVDDQIDPTTEQDEEDSDEHPIATDETRSYGPRL